MKDFIITCNGNLINYKWKNACNAQLLFHYFEHINSAYIVPYWYHVVEDDK